MATGEGNAGQVAARMRFGDVRELPAGHVRPIEGTCDLTLDANFSNHRTGAEVFKISRTSTRILLVPADP